MKAAIDRDDALELTAVLGLQGPYWELASKVVALDGLDVCDACGRPLAKVDLMVDPVHLLRDSLPGPIIRFLHHPTRIYAEEWVLERLGVVAKTESISVVEDTG
jgi:hypothetical protein